jgi:hypothetical protein
VAQFGPTNSLPKPVKPSEVRTSWATVLIWAVSRWGKTNAIRTLVDEGFRVLIVATDQGDAMGLQTISDLPDDRVTIVPVNDWPEAMLVFAELSRDKHKGIATYMGEKYDVMVNDSLSGFGEIWMARALEVMGKEEVGVAYPGWDPRRVYGYIPEKGRQTTKGLTNIAAHCIFLCRETQSGEGEGAARITFPAPEMPGEKLPRELPGWLDAVGYGKFIQGDRVILTEAEGKVVAGIRAPQGRRFPKYILPNYGLLIKAMTGDDDAMRRLAYVPKAQQKVASIPPVTKPTAVGAKQ